MHGLKSVKLLHTLLAVLQNKDVFSTMFHSDYILNCDIIWWLYIQIRFCTKSHYSINGIHYEPSYERSIWKPKDQCEFFHYNISNSISWYAGYLAVFRFYWMSIFRDVPVSWTFFAMFLYIWENNDIRLVWLCLWFAGITTRWYS